MAARRYFIEALEIRRRTSNNIGHVLLKLKRHDEALDHLRQALAIQQELGNRFDEGIAQNTLGQVYQDLCASA